VKRPRFFESFGSMRWPDYALRSQPIYGFQHTWMRVAATLWFTAAATLWFQAHDRSETPRDGCASGAPMADAASVAQVQQGSPTPFAGAPYSSWRRHQMPFSLRPFGARSSHWYMPHRPSSPRA
jgi:hypothetical protein